MRHLRFPYVFFSHPWGGQRGTAPAKDSCSRCRRESVCTKWLRNNGLSMVHERYRRQTDGFAIAYTRT